MFWLYFARDFYRTGQGSANAARKHAPNHRVHLTQVAQVVCPALTHTPKTKPQLHLVEQPAIDLPDVSPATFLQRLSVEGDHAFGVWDGEAGFSMFSANFERVTGLSSGECAGHDWIHSIHNDQQYSLNESLLNAKQGIDGNCLVQARDGSDNWRWLMVEVKAPKPRQPHIMVLFRDMTEQKALETTVKQMESSLAVSERSRSAFLSSMSHELRTPLNAIMGFSEMMKSGVFGPLANPTYEEYTQHIHDSGSTLLQKVNDLLDIASMDAGGLELEEEPFFLQELLTEVVEMHSHQAFTRNQIIKVDYPYAMEIEADRAKLICAMSHLIANALRHSKEGEEITLSVRANPSDGVILSVRDSGEGIAPVQLEIIRNALAADIAYFNIESGGIGLGLSLAKELAARHGGKVMIDSIRHRGTVASLILPEERVLRGMPQKRRHRS